MKIYLIVFHAAPELFYTLSHQLSLPSMLIHTPVRFRSYAFFAVRAKQGSVILRKINRSFDDPVVVHFKKVAFTHFLIMCDEAFTIGTTDFQDVTATDFFTIWIFIYFHIALS